MDIVIKRYNTAHNSDSKLLNAFNGSGLLQNYVAARLTNNQTIRLLLYQDQLEEEEQAIAEQIAKKVIDTIQACN